MKRLILATTLLLLSACATPPNAEQSPTDSELQGTLKIGGSSETMTVLERLSEVYQAQTEGVEIEFFSPSQTSGGIQGIKDNLLDIGGVSREIEPEPGEKLQYIALTRTPLVLIVHNSVTGVKDLTKSQIQAIYQGKIRNWREVGGPDAEIVILDMTEDENEKIVLRQAFLGSDLEITSAAIVFAEDDELIQMAAITPHSIAAVPLNAELQELPVQVMAVEGVSPSQDTLADGTYQGAIDLGVVTDPQPSQLTQDFINFALSVEGQTLLLEETEETSD